MGGDFALPSDALLFEDDEGKANWARLNDGSVWKWDTFSHGWYEIVPPIKEQ